MRMKRTLSAALLLSLLIVGAPLAAVYSDGGDAPKKEKDKIKIENAETQSDAELSIRLLVGEEVREMSSDEYLVGVVAAEMPASFEEEALKAQAVAARTYLRRYIEEGSRHEGADICADANCCQAYLPQDRLRENWGDKYDAYIKKIRKAVSATDGEYLEYDGKAALAAFHSSSAGQTESSADVWGEVPYLVSVSSPEKAEAVPNFVSTLTQSELDFRDTLLHLKPEADFTGPADTWIGETQYTEGGRVGSIVIGGVSFTGAEIRQLFSLRSTAFEIAKTEGGFSFTVTGYGHGVGMSQYGANTMAKEGSTYREILAHYYPGTTLISPKK